MNGVRELWRDHVLVLGVMYPLCWEAERTDPKAASRENHREQDACGAQASGHSLTKRDKENHFALNVRRMRYGKCSPKDPKMTENDRHWPGKGRKYVTFLPDIFQNISRWKNVKLSGVHTAC